MKATFHPTVTVTDLGDGTASVEFDWEGAINPKHAEGDFVDGGRLSHAMDNWVGRPESYHIVIPKDTRTVAPKIITP